MTKNILFSLFFFGLTAVSSINTAFSADSSIYDRIMRTKTIRCGYIPYEPFVSKDLITGELSGVTVDFVNSVAKRLGLEVDWAGEINIDQIATALDMEKFDMLCDPATPDLNWDKVLGYAGDMGALPYYVYVGADSNITDKDLRTARFVTTDGYAYTEITDIYFPDANLNQLQQTVSTAEMYDQIRYGKSDAIINENISARNYMDNNPEIIRKHSDTPLVAMKMFMITKKGDLKLADFISDNFNANEGENLELMRSLLEKYGVEKGSLLLGDECVNQDKNGISCVTLKQLVTKNKTPSKKKE